MLQIVKASAGSGKTTLLSNIYIDMLLRSDDPQEYRHILAVTFTNKATEEMKDKILSVLFKKACDPSDKDCRKAARILHSILHDYGNFSVSTIDSFFQRTLRAFAHETGHYSSSQVELSKDSLTDEAVDTILDNLDEGNFADTQLLDFIAENMEQEAESGRGVRIDDALKVMAKDLRSEEFWKKASELELDIRTEYTPERLSEIRKLVNGIAYGYVKTLVGKADALLKAADSIGLKPEDFKGGSRSWFNYFVKVSEVKKGFSVPAPSTACRNTAADPDTWFSKGGSGVKAAAESALAKDLDGYFEYYDNKRKSYVTSMMIMGSVYGLAIAQRLETTFEAIAEQRNVICLDESNRLLKDIIDGSDAPFVYEKTGTRIRHYLLDEFQDTSTTQWANFQPLLQEAVANDDQTGAAMPKVSNLIVGDVKQSIYRWRESDWSLMESGVAAVFPQACQETLLQNYRSCEEIIKFNSEFYPEVARKLDERCGSNDYITKIYADVCQTPGKDNQKGKGYVEIRYCDGVEGVLDRIVEVIKREIGNGARPCDIAVLVRKNDKGTKIAQRLVEEGLKVETEASFELISSISVRRLVSMLSYVNNPGDTLNAYVARTMDISTFPTAYHDLAGLCDSLCLALKNDERYGADCDREVVFISAFMDFVRDFAAGYGNNLGSFLEYWDEANGKSSKPSISSSLSSDAVRILTIHKSKGLAFPYVIVPFVEDIILYNSKKTAKWCAPKDVEGTELEPLGDKLFKVSLSGTAAQSYFAEDYAHEWLYQSVDAINMMYVATTRARFGMTIISGKIKADAFSGLLADYTQNADKEIGAPCNYSDVQDTGQETGHQACPMEYSVFPLGERLGIRPYAEDYFKEQNNEYGTLAPAARGIVLHEILSRVTVPSDIPAAARHSVDDGSLSEESYDTVVARLQGAVEAHPEFFPQDAAGHLPDGYRILREAPILCPDGSTIRPDRVVIAPDSFVTIVDYKFGKEDDPQYTVQMRTYADAFRLMGYEKVEAALWFVFKNYLRQVGRTQNNYD